MSKEADGRRELVNETTPSNPFGRGGRIAAWGRQHAPAALVVLEAALTNLAAPAEARIRAAESLLRAVRDKRYGEGARAQKARAAACEVIASIMNDTRASVTARTRSADLMLRASKGTL